MNTPHPSPDPLAPVTRAELHAELAPIRGALARIRERLEHVATKKYVGARLEHVATKKYVGARLEHVATKEYIGARLEHVATKEYIGARLEHVATKEYIGARLEHVATKEYVLKGLLGITGVIAALLSVAVGIILRFG